MLILILVVSHCRFATQGLLTFEVEVALALGSASLCQSLRPARRVWLCLCVAF